MKIIFVRHTQSEANHKRIYAGRIDYDLTELGEVQAIEISNSVEILYDTKEFSKDTKIYTSPLIRCKKLAEKIAKNKGFEVVDVETLIEYNFGVFEGKSTEEIKDKIEYKKWSDDYINYKIPKGESLIECNERIINFLDEICKKDEDAIVITHEGVIKLSILHLLKLPIDNFWNFYSGNGAIVDIEYNQGFAYLKNLVNGYKLVK
ncbi:MAG: histidine phosphatase family protein [Sarcina sp.]